MKIYSLWGNGGGDDVLVAENISVREAEELLRAEGLSNRDGWTYFLVKDSRTAQCKARGNVRQSDIAAQRLLS